MTDKPLTTDPEQQHADNVASRRQSGLDPLPGGDDTRDTGEADRADSEQTGKNEGERQRPGS